MFGVVESIAVLRRPPLPEDMRPVVFLTDFLKNVLADPQVFGEDDRYRSAAQAQTLPCASCPAYTPGSHLSHTLPVAPSNRGGTASRFLSVHTAASVLACEVYSFPFLLYPGHMTVFALHPRSFVFASPVGLNIGVLELGQKRSRDAVFEILKVYPSRISSPHRRHWPRGNNWTGGRPWRSSVRSWCRCRGCSCTPHGTGRTSRWSRVC